jgi:acetylornithine deacetylase/succinyl-diaminopimelate desuccinylase-like protein
LSTATEVSSYLKAHEDFYLDIFFRLLRQPSVSAQRLGVVECAALLRDSMEMLGVEAEVLSTAGLPIVYGQLEVDPGAPTVLLYGHYDVQPPEPYEAWISPPFEPTVRDGRVFARGSADNKGQLLSHLFAIHAMREIGRLPKLNYKFLFDGEEEMGSPSLPAFVESNRERFRADLLFGADGHHDASGRPSVVFGVRGLLYVELECEWANKDLHSGQYGNVVPNPAWTLVQLLAGMKDVDGRVTIPGYYDDVIPPTPHEQELLSRIPHDPEAYERDLGLEPGIALSADRHFEGLAFLPTLNIAGFKSGYLGEGVKTVLPSRATVKIDMRLVKNQDPEDIYSKFASYVAEHAPHVKVRRVGGAVPPARSSAETAASQAIIRSVREVWGSEPVVVPSLGGTLPLYPFTDTLAMPMVWVPYGNPDETNHSPNENMSLAAFWRGIATSAAVFEALAELKRGEFATAVR